MDVRTISCQRAVQSVDVQRPANATSMYLITYRAQNSRREAGKPSYHIVVVQARCGGGGARAQGGCWRVAN